MGFTRVIGGEHARQFLSWKKCDVIDRHVHGEP